MSRWVVLGIRRNHGGIEMQPSTAPGVCQRRVALGVRFRVIGVASRLTREGWASREVM